jgi:ABC-2 type transport system permease protein
LYLRGFLRGGEYLGLYLRLLVIGAVIVAVLSPVVAVAWVLLSCFFIWLAFSCCLFIINMMKLSLPICIQSRQIKNRLHLSGCDDVVAFNRSGCFHT